MSEYPRSEVDRAMKVQEVILRAMSGELLWMHAAEILGVSCRTMQRWKRRYERYGYDGLFDRRRQRPSPKRVPMATVQQVLHLYRDEYAGFNVRHFHEKLLTEHDITLSYAWVKKALQTAGLVPKGRRRGKHRQRRPRRPLPGMMVFCDGSTHEWIPALRGQHQDLIAFLDDATNIVYAAYLVEEEGTLTVLAGLRQVIAQQGLFCSLYTDRGSHFFTPPKHPPPAGGHAPPPLTQIGRALKQLDIEHIPSYCPQGRGRIERLFGTWQGRLPQELGQAGITDLEAANHYIRTHFLPWHNQHLSVAASAPGTAFVPLGDIDLDAIVCVQHTRVVQNDHTVVLGRRRLQIEPVDWQPCFAKCRVTVCEHLDGTLSIRYGPRLLGRYTAEGKPLPIPKRTAA